MLILPIETLPDSGIVRAFETDPGTFQILTELTRSGESIFARPVHTRLKARPVGDIIEVSGDIRTTVGLACCRCLVRFDHGLASDFSLVFSRHVSGESEMEEGALVDLTEEQIGTVLFEGDVIDLTDIIQEQIVMALPMRPLCDPVCKGLCPECGANQNRGNCGCGRNQAGNPFSALKNLKLD